MSMTRFYKQMQVEEFQNLDTKVLRDLSQNVSQSVKEEDRAEPQELNTPPCLLEKPPQIQAYLHMIEVCS